MTRYFFLCVLIAFAFCIYYAQKRRKPLPILLNDFLRGAPRRCISRQITDNDVTCHASAGIVTEQAEVIKGFVHFTAQRQCKHPAKSHRKMPPIR